MRELMTNFIKKNEIHSNWFMIDATNAVVGRLATIVSKIIRGKIKQHILHIWMMEILWLLKILKK